MRPEARVKHRHTLIRMLRRLMNDADVGNEEYRRFSRLVNMAYYA
jgi:hypothetical protein